MQARSFSCFAISFFEMLRKHFEAGKKLNKKTKIKIKPVATGNDDVKGRELNDE